MPWLCLYLFGATLVPASSSDPVVFAGSAGNFLPEGKKWVQDTGH